MRDCRGHVLAVVQEGDDAGVQTFQTSAIVLKFKNKIVLKNFEEFFETFNKLQIQFLRFSNPYITTLCSDLCHEIMPRVKPLPFPL